MQDTHFGAYAPPPSPDERPTFEQSAPPSIQWMHRRPSRAAQAVKIGLSLIGLTLIVAAVLR